MNKYRNIKTVVDGITFDSKAEAKYYGTLKMMKLAGEIDRLYLQVKFPLLVKGELICTYIADFVTWKGLDQTVIDAKGVRTPEYKLKAKLMKAINNITIKEV